jgi:hypothetical protein
MPSHSVIRLEWSCGARAFLGERVQSVVLTDGHQEGVNCGRGSSGKCDREYAAELVVDRYQSTTTVLSSGSHMSRA